MAMFTLNIWKVSVCAFSSTLEFMLDHKAPLCHSTCSRLFDVIYLKLASLYLINALADNVHVTLSTSVLYNYTLVATAACMHCMLIV